MKEGSGRPGDVPRVAHNDELLSMMMSFNKFPRMFVLSKKCSEDVMAPT